MKKILEFWAPWCKACRGLEPVLAMVKDVVEVSRVNIEEEPETGENFHVQNLPTVIFLDDGLEVGRVIGASVANMQHILHFAEIHKPVSSGF